MKKEKVLNALEEAEHSLITTYRHPIWSKFCKAIQDYDLISENDCIGVCISGGKDSFVMAKLFQELLRHSTIPFSVKFIVMNPGYNEVNLEKIKYNLNLLNIPATIVETNIFTIANKQEKNPCFVCAKMRRGALYRIAKDLGCNKIALGHHYDDVIETILMNLLNTGSYQSMLPKLHSDNYEDMELIRPMYLIREKDIIRWKNHNNLEFLDCACKFTLENNINVHEQNSKRLQTKLLIQELISYNSNVEKNLLKSQDNINLNMVMGYKKNNKYYSYLDEYKKEK